MKKQRITTRNAGKTVEIDSFKRGRVREISYRERVQNLERERSGGKVFPFSYNSLYIQNYKL